MSKQEQRGYIGQIYGVTILESQVFIKSKPKWFPSHWLWYTMAGWFTESYTKDVGIKR